MTKELAPIDPIRQALAKAESIDDLKQVRDMATAAKSYAAARGLGMDAENQAAEYILRAERGIGQRLLELKDNGKIQGGGGVSKRRELVEDVALLLQERERTVDELCQATGASRDTMRNILHSQRFESVGDYQAVSSGWRGIRRDAGTWRVVPGYEPIITLRDLGLRDDQSSNFQRLASLPDDLFEKMLAAARAASERIAKVNFYRKPSDRPKPEVAPTSENKDFDALRRGVYGLLGWRINSEGVGEFTKNDLTLLPDDELRQIVVMLNALAEAFRAVKVLRGG